MRLVLDTNTVLSALLWRGTPYRLTGKAEIIVSGDKDLLDLAQYQGIRILTAAAALQRLQPNTAS